MSAAMRTQLQCVRGTVNDAAVGVSSGIGAPYATAVITSYSAARCKRRLRMRALRRLPSAGPPGRIALPQKLAKAAGRRTGARRKNRISDELGTHCLSAV